MSARSVGDLSGIRDGKNGDAKDWGSRGNQSLHRWAFDRFITMLEYKSEERGIAVETVDERNTSKTCACCGRKDGNQCVERGLYVCEGVAPSPTPTSTEPRTFDANSRTRKYLRV